MQLEVLMKGKELEKRAIKQMRLETSIPSLRRIFWWNYRSWERGSHGSKQTVQKKSIINRVFLSYEWLLSWPNHNQYVQPREVFDHYALVVKFANKDWAPRPFRSIDAWQLEPSFREMMRGKWGSYLI